MGPAIPHRIGRHVHRKARPDIDSPPAPATGIDYLHLIETAHTAELAQRLRYDQLDDQHDGDQHDGDQHDGDQHDGDHDLAGQDRADAALEAELAGFADLLHRDGQLPGQLARTDCPGFAEPGEPDCDNAGRAS